MTVANQYLDQVPESLRLAVLGNVGSLISFRVGSTDAKVLAGEFGDGYTPNNFTELGNYEVSVRMLTQGQQTPPFSGKTLPPLRQ